MEADPGGRKPGVWGTLIIALFWSLLPACVAGFNSPMFGLFLEDGVPCAFRPPHVAFSESHQSSVEERVPYQPPCPAATMPSLTDIILLKYFITGRSGVSHVF